MGKKATRSVYRNRIDYSGLLSELQQDAAANGKAKAAEKEAEKAAGDKAASGQTKQEPSLFRQRILSNEQVKFLYSGSDTLIHDKSCKEARQISDDDLLYTQKYLPERKQCPECAVKAYVRIGAKDFKNYDTYLKLFEKMRMQEHLIRHMYVDCGMSTMASANVLTVWDREDTWKIVSLDAKGSVQLLHNNYHLSGDGERHFSTGYHVQNDSTQNTSVGYAVKAIKTYSFDEHQAARSRIADKEAVDKQEGSGRQQELQQPQQNGQETAYHEEIRNVREKGLLQRAAAWLRALWRRGKNAGKENGREQMP